MMTSTYIHPGITVSDCPPFDVLCVPGGAGLNALMQDEEVLDFIRRQGRWSWARLGC